MSMEKRGVVDGEGTAPPAVKQAEQACARPACCKGACGTDPMSKLAEAVADKTTQPGK
jgi:hypothetical protein